MLVSSSGPVQSTPLHHSIPSPTAGERERERDGRRRRSRSRSRRRRPDAAPAPSPSPEEAADPPLRPHQPLRRHPLPQAQVAAAKGKDKATRELQTSTTHLNKIQRISKPKVKTGGVLPGPSSPPSKNTRKIARKEQPHTEPLISPLFASSKTKVKTGGNMLPDASTLACKKTMKVTREKQPCMEPLISPVYPSSKTKARTGDGRSGASSPSSKKTRKVTSGEEEQADKMELLEDTSCDEEPPVPMQGFIEERRAYFAEVDAFELVEEFASSGSDTE
ncbi:serine/arginine repetitive matrix protein 1-like isoform X2 [Hordeum vulgare subsp. vulgare]|uniref:serine/arginine repetitive matrix protein 1-like isoform X2 n=1 Tax=Hordeum vulgare subsp. vulgare TaxID=112509 RepID=UPI001D1A422F|nr:serine/arginine repetitive matrix protein 1-like isoform X2 [Hordeum vulgare subsp. vulgare]